MLTSIFILDLNNGDSYEDYKHWNAGVFRTLQEAKDFAFEHAPKGSSDYTVEEWNMMGKVKDHYFEL